MNQTKFEFNGITFRIHYSFPAAISESKNPCRALVTPLHPADGKAITKKQLYNKSAIIPSSIPSMVVIGRTSITVLSLMLRRICIVKCSSPA